MQHPETDTGSPGPWWGKEEQIEAVNVRLMIGTRVSHSPRILTSKDNLASCVQAGGNGNMSSTLAG